ncbi:MAG: GAF domain-containing protein [Terriglobales bacterium]|jgi:phosphoserine phosphatase RsbU/P
MTPSATQSATAPFQLDQFLVEVADVVNTTLDLDALLLRTAELVHRAIEYEIFAIMLLNEKTQELRIRFQIGHPPEFAERLRVKVGEGVTGRAAQSREAVLVNDVSADQNYIKGVEGVRSELAVPLIVKNKVIGVIDLEAPQPGYFTEEHSRLLTLVASRIASGIENARLYTRVSRQAQTLTLLNEISRDLTSILNLDELMQSIAETLTRLIDYQMFSILLLDGTGQNLVHRFSLRFKENIQLKHDIPLGRGLVGAAAQLKQAIVVPDVSKDPRYIMANPETKSELCVPLIHKGAVIGVLDLEHTRRNYFTEDHKRTMTTLAAQLAIAIENARLYERIAKQEARLEHELDMAREIQLRLLPQELPRLRGAEVAAKFLPARTISGDMYEFLQYSGDSTAVMIGDVSGKGAPAALYAALVAGILRSAADSEPSPAEMLSLVNTALSERPISAQYISMIYALWDGAQGILRIANSGLPRPIYSQGGGKTEIVQATGLPLGPFEDATFEELDIHVSPGDVFVFFSDGISDAANPALETFGRARIEKIVAANHQKSAKQIADAIFKGVREFCDGCDLFDDETVVVLKISKDFRPA